MFDFLEFYLKNLCTISRNYMSENLDTVTEVKILLKLMYKNIEFKIKSFR